MKLTSNAGTTFATAGKQVSISVLNTDGVRSAEVNFREIRTQLLVYQA